MNKKIVGKKQSIKDFQVNFIKTLGKYGRKENNELMTLKDINDKQFIRFDCVYNGKYVVAEYNKSDRRGFISVDGEFMKF